MKALTALTAVLLAVTVNAQHEHGGDGRMTCPQAGYMYPNAENLCFVYFCTAPDEPPIKRMCPKGVRVPTWWEGGFLNMCFVVNILKHHGEPVCLRCDAYDIPPETEGCASNPCDEGCTCEDTEYTFRCNCPDTGIYTPVETVPMPVNHCEPEPCENGAVCQNQWDGFFCICPNGWTGHRCETSVCDWHSCYNGGTCVIDEIGWHCECTACYTGSCCKEEIPECNGDPINVPNETDLPVQDPSIQEPPVQEPSCGDCMIEPECKVRLDTCDCTKTPCPPNSRCEDLSDVHSHECFCDDCWEGPSCNKRKRSCACDNNCPEGAQCYDDVAGPSCSCGDCVKGPLCDEPIVSCNCNNPCEEDKRCVMDPESGPVCLCPDCFEGENCDIPINNCTCNNPCKEESMCKMGDDGPFCECDCIGDEECFQNVLTGVPECRCPPCKRNAYRQRGCLTDITHLCECNDCTGDQEVCVDGEDEDGDVVCKIGNPSSGNAFTVVFEENDTERSFKEIPLELYITGAVWNSGTRFVNIKSAGLKETHHCYFNSNVTVPENKVERFTVERCMMQNATGLERLAITLTELNNKTMTVYGVNKDRWTADAFLALPDAMAGKEFQTFSYSPAHISSQFAIAVLYDDTEVTMKLADDNDLPRPYNKKGAVFKQTLNAFDTYQVQARCKGQRPSKKRRCHLDLTGSVITSNKPIHAFSGNVRAFIPAGEAFSRDHLVEELVPRDRWGTEFGLISIPGRAVGDLLQIMAVDMEQTQVFVYSSVHGKNQKDVYSLPIKGKYHTSIEIPSNGRFFLKSSGKLSVIQYTKSRDSDYMYRNETIHDPVSITVPPIQQFTNNFFISSPMFTGGIKFNLQPYNTTYALLVAKSGEERDIVLNGQAITRFVSPWAPLPTSEDPDDPALVAAVVEIPPEAYATNVIRNTEGNNFQCLVYGYDDRESFGMPVAMALAKLHG